MDRQTTLAFVLIFIIITAWLFMNTPEAPPPDQKKPVPAKTETAKQEAPKVVTATTAETADLGKHFGKFTGSPEIITIENDLAVIEFSSKGGKLNKVFLKKYDNWSAGKNVKDTSVYGKNVQLINTYRGGAFDVFFVTTDGKKINTGDLKFNSTLNKSYYRLSGGDSLSFTYYYKSGDSAFIKKNFTYFGDKYDSKFDLELVNFGKIISNNAYDLVWDSGIRFVEANSADEATYSNASVHYGDEQVIIDAPASGEKIESDFNGRVDWLTIRNKYFAAILVPQNPDKIEGAFVKGNAHHYKDGGIKEFYSGRFKLPFREQEYLKTSFFVYVGPVSYDILKNYPGDLTQIVDFGSFFGLKSIVRPIAEYVLLPLFEFLHSLILNYGLVIIVFSLIIKVLLNPLTKKSMDSMRKMQVLTPQITEIKEKFKDDPAKMNKETMKLYSTYGINPMGGCLPLILQMPIFVALWGVFQTAIELRQQPFIWWITDLSRPDVLFHLPFKIPLFGVDQVSGLALLMGITTFVQQKMSIKDPQQMAMVYVMPIMLTILFMSFPSGLNLYYFLFNVLSIGQQYYLNHYAKPLELQPVKGPKKTGFMQRMMEAAEQKAKDQQKAKRK